MSLIKKAAEKVYSKLITLNATRKIEHQDLQLPEWQLMKNEYDENQNSSWVERAACSVINSILFQKRVFFVITRRNTRELLQNDRNWDKPIGLKDSNYPKLLQFLTESDLIRLVQKDNRAHVYEVVEPNLLSLLQVDVTAQKEEALQFVTQGTKKGTTKGTKKGTESKSKREKENKKSPPYSVSQEVNTNGTTTKDSITSPAQELAKANPESVDETTTANIPDVNVELDDLDTDTTDFSLLNNKIAAENKINTRVKEFAQAFLTTVPAKLKNYKEHNVRSLADEFFSELVELGCSRNSSKAWLEEFLGVNIMPSDHIIKIWAKNQDRDFSELKRNTKDERECTVQSTWLQYFYDNDEDFKKVKSYLAANEGRHVNGQSMSPEEYLKQRKLADSFPRLDIKSLPKIQADDFEIDDDFFDED